MGADRYIRRNMRHVEGWLKPLTAQIIAALGRHQAAMGLTGAVGEIGVHHGKLWLLLDHLAAPDEIRFAIDLFDRQDLNKDGSGRGNLERFKKNRERYGVNASNMKIIAASSLDLKAEQLLSSIGRVRLLSIDGGHTAECTKNDLDLADAVLKDGGIAALDDVFNEQWPGVMTGFAAYMGSKQHKLVPFCIVPEKVLLCHPGNAKGYADVVCNQFGANLIRSHDLFGYALPIFIAPTTLAFWVKSHVHGTFLEGIARRFYHWFLR